MADSTGFLTGKNIGKTVFVLQSKVEVDFLDRREGRAGSKLEFCFVGSV